MDDRAVAFFDVETTHLSGEHPDVLLLELAMVVVRASDLQELDRQSMVIAYTSEELEKALWHPIARQMHEVNNLLVDVVSPSAISLQETERRLLESLSAFGRVDLSVAPDNPGHGAESSSAPLWGGCSVQLDRSIVRRVLPRVYERVHYRSIDATTLRTAAELWTPWRAPKREKRHRALEDALGAVELTRAARTLLMPQLDEAFSIR